MSEAAIARDAIGVANTLHEGAPILRVRNVGKAFGHGPAATVALQDVSLDVAAGEFVTIVGASGCGKSTLLNLIAGLDEPTSGSIEVDVKVAFMFQEATLLPWLTARQNVELALKLSHVPKRDRATRAEDLLESVRLEGWGDKRPHELSGGCASASRWPAASRRTPASCSWTSPSAPWTR